MCCHQIRAHLQEVASQQTTELEELRQARDLVSHETEDLHRQVTAARADAESATRESVNLSSQLELANTELAASRKQCAFLEELVESVRAELRIVQQTKRTEVRRCYTVCRLLAHGDASLTCVPRPAWYCVCVAPQSHSHSTVLQQELTTIKERHETTIAGLESQWKAKFEAEQVREVVPHAGAPS